MNNFYTDDGKVLYVFIDGYDALRYDLRIPFDDRSSLHFQRLLWHNAVEELRGNKCYQEVVVKYIL